MRIRVNPTRMQLLRLRRRLELARRGHKLLKDKLDGLVQRFFTLKKDYLESRDKLGPELTRLFGQSAFAFALSAPEVFETNGPPALPAGRQPTVTLNTTYRSLMGVKIPDYHLKIEGEPVFNELLSSVELREAVTGFSAVLPELVSLAALVRSLRLIAGQIIETRRRVNALEYILIPELDRNARAIMMKLSEQERSSKVILLKLGG
jgi:V/A-type H+/Na+-transporting ATPase subunit D